MVFNPNVNPSSEQPSGSRVEKRPLSAAEKQAKLKALKAKIAEWNAQSAKIKAQDEEEMNRLMAQLKDLEAGKPAGGATEFDTLNKIGQRRHPEAGQEISKAVAEDVAEEKADVAETIRVYSNKDKGQIKINTDKMIKDLAGISGKSEEEVDKQFHSILASEGYAMDNETQARAFNMLLTDYKHEREMTADKKKKGGFFSRLFKRKE